MTRTTPLRRMILQLRQIFFTEASTFMSHLSLPPFRTCGPATVIRVISRGR